MTAAQYKRIQDLLTKAEEITEEHPLLTPQGRKIQAEIRSLAVLVEAEKLRAEKRDDVSPSRV